MSPCAQAPPHERENRRALVVKRKPAFIMAAVLVSTALIWSSVVAQETEEEEAMASATEVNVTLQEWAVLPDTLSVPAGSVTFNATNIGPMDVHELVVVKTDIPAAELPTREDGAFDEEAEGVEVIGEIEEFDVGLTESLTLELAPGKYVLLCNLVQEEDGAMEAHYQMGMWVEIEVTA
jgi:uncharacterized cupredoxin-like copper-binding protein